MKHLIFILFFIPQLLFAQYEVWHETDKGAQMYKANIERTPDFLRITTKTDTLTFYGYAGRFFEMNGEKWHLRSDDRNIYFVRVGKVHEKWILTNYLKHTTIKI